VRNEPLRPVTKEDIRGEIEHAVATAGGKARARLERSYAEIAFPTMLPAYDKCWWTMPTSFGCVRSRAPVRRPSMVGRYFDPDEAIPQVRVYRLERGRANH